MKKKFSTSNFGSSLEGALYQTRIVMSIKTGTLAGSHQLVSVSGIQLGNERLPES